MDHERSVEPEAAPETPAPAVSEPVRLASPRAERRNLWPVVALLAVLVVGLSATLVVVRPGEDDRPRAEIGQLFEVPFAEDELSHYGQVLLPWARTKVGAGAPREELPDLLGEQANVRAPEGGRFVPVEVKLEEDYAIPLSSVGRPYVQQTEVVLRADGRDYPLSGRDGLVLDPEGRGPQGGGVWVAVDGDPTELEVRVTVDGVTQVVHASDGSVEGGQADRLGELPSPEELLAREATPCGTPRRLDDSEIRVGFLAGLECRVQRTLRTPYVDGLGWAEEGREFLVVHVVRPRRLSLVSGRGDATTSWDADDLQFSAHLGNAEPLRPAANVNDLNAGRLSILDPADPAQFVFDVAMGKPTLDLRFDYQGQAVDREPFVRERREVHFQWTVPGGDL
ncbi:hypothetical protein JK386_12595 [Nocardioides sp. zg-536]|uniref:Uncharacterized protein n=1 Tax=Nocardioides faecalis TaxID=2803858 RepID=A0A938Y7L2_9ACTN|nr:hypothetical protein [Nocardioides faecalis]MBM9460745.1 hypothetical protein [Nocardioides faecalis]QVI57942.1 hypothetical protein KG111_12970 [Nocardioides faecalis]